MDTTFLVGLIGSIIVVTGAAWPESRKIRPVKSIKSWLFAISGVMLLTYAILGYQAGGPIFFIFIQILILIAHLLGMLELDDRIDTAVISVGGLVLIGWSLSLFEGYNTVLFILGLIGLGLGYAFQIGSLRRDVALTLGSIFVAAFSYIEASWVFFWLNAFFTIFSGYYLVKNLAKKR